MKILRKISQGLTLLLLSTVAVQLSPAPGQAAPTTLKAVVLENFPPQYSLSAKGKPQGFAIDIMDEVARLADLEVQYLVKESWSEMYAAIKSGEADLIPNNGITEKRKQESNVLNFTANNLKQYTATAQGGSSKSFTYDTDGNLKNDVTFTNRLK